MKESFISKQKIEDREAVQGEEIREAIFDLIQKDFPDFTFQKFISIDELNKYRRMYLTSLILREKGELDDIEKEVLDAIKNNSLLSEDIIENIESKLTFGQRIADKVAAFGGSWTFIITFFTFIFIWMAINVYYFSAKAFDPYPFILLNLILSCLAAIQAPLILMSQNRQEQKDRERSEQDFKTNLKAELEIKLLNEKMDHLMINQNKKLLEFQDIQVDYLEDLLKELKKN